MGTAGSAARRPRKEPDSTRKPNAFATSNGQPATPLTVRQVGHRLAISDDVVRDCLRKMKLKGVKTGGHWRVFPADLAEFLSKAMDKT